MFAIFEDGSRQYRVSEGDIVQVDFRDVEVGARVEFHRVLLYQGPDDTRIGQPIIEGARVLAEVVDHPSSKLYVQHFRRRKNYRKLRGHRQPYTEVQIRYILLPGMDVPTPPPSEAATPPTPETAAPTPAGSPTA